MFRTGVHANLNVFDFEQIFYLAFDTIDAAASESSTVTAQSEKMNIIDMTQVNTSVTKMTGIELGVRITLARVCEGDITGSHFTKVRI